MKRSGFLIGLCLWALGGFAQQRAITDGPYVFYRNGLMVVKSVVEVKGVYTARADSFAAGKAPKTLRVRLDGHPDWDFTVKLRDKIVNEPVYSPGADKVLALSDIEGEFEPFRNLLLQAGVIDGQYNWIFGKGSLVVAGDLFDRGKQVAQYLWLLYKLEDEARAKGGVVHVVLGNHEMMNLSGDVRYVDSVYFAGCSLMGEDYGSLYKANTELGRWLRSKNTIEKDGDLLVLHGGVSPILLQRGLQLTDINTLSRPYYAARYRAIPDSLKDLFNEQALFWYRGYFLEPKAGQGQIDSTLEWYGVKKILVGHDIIDHVAAFYNNKLVGLDVNEHEGVHEALLIDKGKYYRIDDKGNKALIF